MSLRHWFPAGPVTGPATVLAAVLVAVLSVLPGAGAAQAAAGSPGPVRSG